MTMPIRGASVMQDDMILQGPGLSWPAQFSPGNAELFSHNEIFIKAPRATVWWHLIAAGKWPQWYSNAVNVRVLNSVAGLLASGSRFRWSTFGIDVESRVHEFVPESRIGWHGDGGGLNSYHVWLLMDKGPGCHVVTQMVGKGPIARALRDLDPQAIDMSHDLWIRGLKLLSEG
ncbi:MULTISPECIES: SRPBCC family protein [Rhodomicrobium]|uniref:SRPBCC family protein n=1 Tax=Rhodomicrobium TaxID=1068 RepID=UPI0014822315|nr:MULTISPECIES: SRPBCC family protein [Rhodomicrobium]